MSNRCYCVNRIGRFEVAHSGDIFLDEISDVPLAIQAKLLRVPETKQFERAGDHRPISVDVRIITATNQQLEELVRQNQFRDDLFCRINVNLERIRYRVQSSLSTHDHCTALGATCPVLSEWPYQL